MRLLSRWVGPDGEVVGTDVDDAMLAQAKQLLADEGLGNVVLRNDDLFATGLEPGPSTWCTRDTRSRPSGAPRSR
jgi:hypothetical protein